MAQTCGLRSGRACPLCPGVSDTNLFGYCEAEVLAPYLDRLSLVAVNFPTFRDGRGFTQARSLRERLAFSAEIRATGNILPDQYAFLLRSGITTVEMQDGADPAAWQKAADRFSFGYQPSVLKEPVLSGLRRTIRLGVPQNAQSQLIGK